MSKNALERGIKNVIKSLSESNDTNTINITEPIRKLVGGIINSSNLIDDRFIVVSESGYIETIISTLSEEEQMKLIKELGGNIESGLLNVIGESLGKDKRAISLFMSSISINRQTGNESGSWRAFLNLGKVIDDYLLANDYLQKALARVPEDKKIKALNEIGIRYLELGNEEKGFKLIRESLHLDGNTESQISMKLALVKILIEKQKKAE